MTYSRVLTELAFKVQSKSGYLNSFRMQAKLQDIFKSRCTIKRLSWKKWNTWLHFHWKPIIKVNCLFRLYLNVPRLRIIFTEEWSIRYSKNFLDSVYAEQSIIVWHLHFLDTMGLRSTAPSLLKVCKNIVCCRTINSAVKVMPWFPRAASSASLLLVIKTL